jgi:hypothetical protein
MNGSQRHPVPALLFGLVHRLVRSRQKGFTLGSCVSNGDANTHRELKGLIAKLHRFGNRFHDATRHLHDFVHIVHTFTHNGKFVAGKPGQCVPGPDERTHAVCHDLEKLIAGLMPQPVVDPFESVDVAEQDRNRLVLQPIRPRQGCLQTVVELAAIGKAGQGVVQRLLGKRIDRSLPLACRHQHTGY